MWETYNEECQRLTSPPSWCPPYLIPLRGFTFHHDDEEIGGGPVPAIAYDFEFLHPCFPETISYYHPVRLSFSLSLLWLCTRKMILMMMMIDGNDADDDIDLADR